MAKSRKRDKRKHHEPRSIWPSGRPSQLLDRATWLRRGFFDGVRERFEMGVTEENRLLGRLWLRVPVRIPAHLDECVLRIKISGESGKVWVDDYPGKFKHRWSEGNLCMWYPSDPPEKKWTIDKGLLALIEMSVVHLFKERYAKEHPSEPWLGEEAPHAPGVAKTDSALAPTSTAPTEKPPTKLKRAA
jgi:hypothetical protein